MLQDVVDAKLSLIDQSKNELISVVKQTSAKLKYILNGTAARDTECLNTSLEAARVRLLTIECALDDTLAVLNKVSDDSPHINVCRSILVIVNSPSLFSFFYMMAVMPRISRILILLGQLKLYVVLSF